MSIWFWVAGVAVIGLVLLGFNAYHSHLEDEGYWVPNSMNSIRPTWRRLPTFWKN